MINETLLLNPIYALTSALKVEGNAEAERQARMWWDAHAGSAGDPYLRFLYAKRDLVGWLIGQAGDVSEGIIGPAISLKETDAAETYVNLLDFWTGQKSGVVTEIAERRGLLLSTQPYSAAMVNNTPLGSVGLRPDPNSPYFRGHPLYRRGGRY